MKNESDALIHAELSGERQLINNIAVYDQLVAVAAARTLREHAYANDPEYDLKTRAAHFANKKLSALFHQPRMWRELARAQAELNNALASKQVFIFFNRSARKVEILGTSTFGKHPVRLYEPQNVVYLALLTSDVSDLAGTQTEVKRNIRKCAQGAIETYVRDVQAMCAAKLKESMTRE